METNSWLWFALVAFLVFCCLPMLFMRHDRHSDHTDKGNPEKKS